MDKRNLMTEKSPINWTPIFIGLGIAVAAVAIIAVFMLRARGVIGPDTKSTSAEYESGATQSATTDYGKAVEAMMKEYMEENGYTVADESYEALQNEISNDIISKLSTLDLSSLSDVEKTQLMKDLRKEILTKLTEDNSFSTYLTSEDYRIIEERLKKLDEAGDADIASLKKTIEELSNKMNTSTSSSTEEYERVKQLIDANKNLTDEQRKELLALIESSKSNLTEVITKLQESTGSDYETIKTELEAKTNEIEQKTVALDAKYAVYYEDKFEVPVSFGASGESTVAITSENIKTYSKINIVYDEDCTSGYTVSYKQEEGKLVLDLKKNAEGDAPASLKGTIYIDNSMVNAQ